MKQENDFDSETGQLVEASWNPFDPDFLINPYRHYEPVSYTHLRAHET